MKTRLALAALGLGLLCLSSSGQVKVNEKFQPYEKVAGGVTGRLTTKGSDTMNQLVTLWGEGFKRNYNAVDIEVDGKGSGIAPPALIEGTATFGPMSREMKNDEISKFKNKYGFPPTGLRTSIDMLAVFVNKDNPLKGLTLAQVDAIFSKTRKAGHKEVKTWGDLGLKGEWENKPISLYGRNSASGTYGYFKEHALQNGDFKPEVKEQPGTGGVVDGVAKDKYAIGYGGIGYRTSDIKPLALAKAEDDEPCPAEPEKAYSGEYPLARPLYLYVNYKPGSNLDPLRREFILYIFSRDGQEDVVKAGYLPVKPGTAEQSLKSVGLKK